MSYSGRMQQSHSYSVFFAPRGRDRMYDLGMQIAQLYLSPYDKLIGVIGEDGSGKSMLIRGMFPGLELTGADVRPLPLLDPKPQDAFTAHTYYIDVRIASADTPTEKLAEAVMGAVESGKRVVAEHFDLIYPMLNGANANLMIGVGDEIIVSRPTIFGPTPQVLHDKVAQTIDYRRMAHTAEDLCEIFLSEEDRKRCLHRDIKHGFLLAFAERPPKVDLDELELKVSTAIASDLPVSYVDDGHIRIGEIVHPCTCPRTHVTSTGRIDEFRLLHRIVYDPIEHCYLIAGRVGPGIGGESIDDVNDFNLD